MFVTPYNFCDVEKEKKVSKCIFIQILINS